MVGCWGIETRAYPILLMIAIWLFEFLVVVGRRDLLMTMYINFRMFGIVTRWSN